MVDFAKDSDKIRRGMQPKQCINCYLEHQNSKDSPALRLIPEAEESLATRIVKINLVYFSVIPKTEGMYFNVAIRKSPQ